MNFRDEIVWKTLRVSIFSILHFFLTVVLLIATAFQLRDIDLPDGGKAEWYQLIIPAIFGLIASPLVPLFKILLPDNLFRGTPIGIISFVLNSLLWGFLLERLLQYLKKRKLSNA